MEPLDQWIEFLEDIIRKIASQRSTIALIHHITPDGIVASIFLKKALESLDSPVEVIPSLPEDLLFTMESIDQAKALILVDLVPLGPGPVSIAHEFFPEGFLIFDHDSVELSYDLKDTIRLNPRTFSLNIPTSYSAYLIAERVDPSSQNLSWLVQIGTYGEMFEPLLGEISSAGVEIQYSEEVSRIYQAVFSLSSVLGEKGARIAFSTLESSIGELSILDTEDPLHSLFWNESNRCLEEITKELSKKPLIQEKNLIVRQISRPGLRFYVAEFELMKPGREISIAYYSDDVLARICVRRKSGFELNVFEIIKEELPLEESSIVGREDYADICIRSEYLDDLLKYMVGLA
jgi:hypothetical protein